MSKRDIVIFGAAKFSSLAWYCIGHDSSYRPVAFCVDAAYIRSPFHEGLPVVPFETLERTHPPESVSILIALGYLHINGLRRARFEQAKARGYDTITYVSSRSGVWPNLSIGENSMVYEGAIVEPFSSIGRNVIVRSGVHIAHHCRIEDHVFVAAGVTLGGSVRIGEQAFVGVGAVIRDGIRIAPRSFVGAGAVVTKDTEPDGVYVGNPARKTDKTALEATRG